MDDPDSFSALKFDRKQLGVGYTEWQLGPRHFARSKYQFDNIVLEYAGKGGANYELQWHASKRRSKLAAFLEKHRPQIRLHKVCKHRLEHLRTDHVQVDRESLQID